MAKTQRQKEVVFLIEYRRLLGPGLEDMIEEEMDTLRGLGAAKVVKVDIRDEGE